MAVDLADHVESLKREVQPPGTELYAGVDDSDWVGYLADAFWEARLDGFLEGFTCDEEGVIEPTSGSDDIDRGSLALVILYAGIRVLRNRILNMGTGIRAKAGPVEFEQQSSATVLTEMLKQLRATKDRIITALDGSGTATSVAIFDAFSSRIFNPEFYNGDEGLVG